MLPSKSYSSKDVWRALFAILLAVGIYAYFSHAPIRKLAALCASVQPGASASGLEKWALSQGADAENTRWSGSSLIIAVRTGTRPFLNTCEVHTKEGLVTSVSKP